MDYHTKLNTEYAMGKFSAESEAFRASKGFICPFCGLTNSSEIDDKGTLAFELDSHLDRQWDKHESVDQRRITVKCQCGCEYEAVASVTDLRERTSTTLRCWDDLDADFVIRHPENVVDTNELNVRYAMMSERQKDKLINLSSKATLKRMGFSDKFLKHRKQERQLSPKKMTGKLRRQIKKNARARKLGYKRPNY